MTLNALISKVVTTLKNQTALQQTEILTAYSGKAFQHLVKKGQIVVGLHSIDFSPAGFGQQLGNTPNAHRFGAWGTVTFSFEIQLPNNQQEISCHQVFGELSQCLIESDCGFYRIWCDQVRPKVSQFATTLPCFATLRSSISSKKPYHPVEQVVVKGGLSNE